MSSVPGTALEAVKQALHMLQLLLQLHGGAVLIQLQFNLIKVPLHVLVELPEGSRFIEFVFMFL